MPWRGPSGPPQPHFLHRAGAVRQSGSTGQTPGEPWSIKTCCPTVPRESNTLWPAWKRSLDEGWLCSGGSVWCISGFVEYYVWSLFFFLFQQCFVLRVLLSCGVFKLTTIQQQVAILAIQTCLEAELPYYTKPLSVLVTSLKRLEEKWALLWMLLPQISYYYIILNRLLLFVLAVIVVAVVVDTLQLSQQIQRPLWLLLHSRQLRTGKKRAPSCMDVCRYWMDLNSVRT